MNLAFAHALEDLVRQGWHTSFSFFDEQLLQDLRLALLELKERDAFRPAKVGKGPKKIREPKIRGDWIRWLSEVGDFPATAAYLKYLDDFRFCLNRELFLGAQAYEAHFAIYPAHTFYKKHIDQHRLQPHRLLTTTLYLNKDYQQEQGGALMIENLQKDSVATIYPEWGRFVCFLSADFPHQVLATKVERYSLTGWMRTR